MSGDNEFLIGIILFFILLCVSIWTVITHGWIGLLVVIIVFFLLILSIGFFTQGVK